MNKAKVLFVDDEPRVLSGLTRNLRNHFDVHTATGGREALELIAANEPFSVIVCDCRMPEMDGIELLQRVTKASPSTIRIMLTGNTDQATAVAAVNKGDVFRFLTKPCESEELKQILALAVRQHELVTAEKELLEQTLKGSIKVLADLLSIAKPEAFGRTARLRRKARELAAHFPSVQVWELDTAALLSQLGCVNVPQEILDRRQRGEALNTREESTFASHPLLGADLISRIPRLERVAKIVLYQNKSFDGTGFPIDTIKGEQIPLEARLLHCVLVYDDLNAQGWSDTAIIERLRKSRGEIDPAVLEALVKICGESASGDVIRVYANELQLGMVVREDIKTDDGVMLLCHGHEVTPAIREHLVKFQKLGVLTKSILVAKPEPKADDAAP